MSERHLLRGLCSPAKKCKVESAADAQHAAALGAAGRSSDSCAEPGAPGGLFACSSPSLHVQAQFLQRLVSCKLAA